MDHHIYEAITGRDRGKYNGKYDEIGIDMHNEVGRVLRNLYVDCSKDGSGATPEQQQRFEAFIKDENSSKCVPYGFEPYNEFMDTDCDFM
jgi:hypothetical protein